MEDEREEPPARSQRTFCCLLASVLTLLSLPVGMSTVGCGWYTLTTHHWTIEGTVWPSGLGGHRPPSQWVPPGRHLVSAAFTGGDGQVWGDSLWPTWRSDSPPYGFLFFGVECPARDVTHLRVSRVRLVDPSGSREVSVKNLMPSSPPDAGGWIALLGFPVPFDWRAETTVDAVWFPAQEPLELVVEYELRATSGEVLGCRFAAPCRHSATTTTTFRWHR